MARNDAAFAARIPDIRYECKTRDWVNSQSADKSDMWPLDLSVYRLTENLGSKCTYLAGCGY